MVNHTIIKGKRPVERPWTRWQDYSEDLGWNRLGLQPSEMLEVVADLMCGGSILSCCPRNPHGHERALKEEKEDFIITGVVAIWTTLPITGHVVAWTTSLVALLHEPYYFHWLRYSFGGPGFFLSQSELFESFVKCSDWLDRSRPSKKASTFLAMQTGFTWTHQWRSQRGWELEPPFVENVTSYLVTIIRILQNLNFIYPI